MESILEKIERGEVGAMHACVCVCCVMVEVVKGDEEEDCVDIELVVVVVAVYGAADDFNQRDNYN